MRSGIKDGKIRWYSQVTGTVKLGGTVKFVVYPLLQTVFFFFVTSNINNNDKIVYNKPI